jgi:catechol 2,3-dioxygenase-like lactoylglutathione lyase family enzyme
MCVQNYQSETDRMVNGLALSHANFIVPDLARHVAYYEEVIGLQNAGRTDGRVYLGAPSGSDALILSEGQHTALAGLTFICEPDKSVEEIIKGLALHGIRGEIRSDPHPGMARSVTFNDLNGFQIELLQEQRFRAPGATRGVAPLRLGHVAMIVPDVKKTGEFYTNVLGFRLGDWVGDYFLFLRSGHEHHTVNFIQSNATRMHHMAFEVQNSAALTTSCDVLAKAKLDILWGPLRHGPGHNVSTYHKNPAGQLVELFTELDLMSNEGLGYYDPRPWHHDRPQRPKVWSTQGPRRDVWGPLAPEGFLTMGS